MSKIVSFDPGDNITLNYSWPLMHGLVFASHLADGGSGNATPVRGSLDVFTSKGLVSGLIHASASPFGRARNRTDINSNFVWDTYERYAVGTGDFTVAVFAKFNAGAGSSLNVFSNGSGVNQWRLMPHYNGAGYAANNATFWTYDGAITQATATAAFDTGVASWLIGVRRGTTLQLWRNNVLLNETVGTARNVTGATSGALQLGNGTANSQGLHGPALMWRRALTAAEIGQLTSEPTPYDFMSSPVNLEFDTSSGPPPAPPSTSFIHNGIYGRKGLLDRKISRQ